jgi:Small metal-binding protein
MHRRFFAVALGLVLAGAALNPALARTDESLTEAVSHTEMAISRGKAGDSMGVVNHAEAALAKAQASEKTMDNEHTKQGIAHLNMAIDEGKKGHADAAAKHAEEALMHLKQAE